METSEYVNFRLNFSKYYMVFFFSRNRKKVFKIDFCQHKCTYFACNASAIRPAASGALAEVPVCVSVH